MIAMSFDDTKDYVLKEDRALPPDEQTVFTLRPLSERARRKIENLLAQDLKLGEETPEEAKLSVPMGDLHAVCLRSGIAGWRNLHDAKGRAVEYRRDNGGELTIDLLRCFTTGQKSELMREIMSLNGLSAGDEKN